MLCEYDLFDKKVKLSEESKHALQQDSELSKESKQGELDDKTDKVDVDLSDLSGGLASSDHKLEDENATAVGNVSDPLDVSDPLRELNDKKDTAEEHLASRDHDLGDTKLNRTALSPKSVGDESKLSQVSTQHEQHDKDDMVEADISNPHISIEPHAEPEFGEDVVAEVAARAETTPHCR